MERCGKPAEELRIAVGRDSRLSGPSLQRAVLTGLVAMGAVAADCGMASTPAMFMATVLPGCDFDGAVMITASHLPQNRNGLKFFTREGGLESADIKELLRRAEAGPEAARLHGRLTSFDILTPYTAMLRQRIITGVNSGERPLAGLKIAVDAGNGAGGFFATRVLAPLGAELLSRTLRSIADGTVQRAPQNNAEATMAPMLEKAMGKLDFTRSAKELHDQIRGMNPWPGCHCAAGGKALKIHESCLAEGHGKPGELIALDPVTVACGEGALRLITVQPEGKPRMAAADWLRGARLQKGECLA